MTVYDFDVKKSDGSILHLKDYQGKVLIIVNTASNCGYTKQLMGLERIYKEEACQSQGLEILAFPCNQFHKQEPDPIEQVVKTYSEKYGVTFPIMDKIDVNGDDTIPLYQFLKGEIGYNPENKPPIMMVPLYKMDNPKYKESPDIKWNFTKFVIDRHGKVRFRFEPEQTPSHMEDSIRELLQE